MNRTSATPISLAFILYYMFSFTLWAQPAGDAGGFRVLKAEPQGVLPAEKLKQPLEVRVQFSSDVVRAAEVGTTTPSALELVPFVEGSRSWRDEKTFVWTLDPRQLPAGSEIHYRVPGELRDRKGRAVTGPREFSFVTPPLSVVGARQVPVTVAGGYAVQLEFNYPVNPEDLANFLTAKSGDHPLAVGGVMAAVAGKERRSRMRPDVPTRTPIVELVGGIENEQAVLVVAAGLPPARGGQPLAERAQVTVKIQPTFVPLQAYGYWKGERGFLAVEFTAPVSLEGAAENVSVTPPVKFSLDRKWGRMGYAQGENTLVLSGDFQPETRYTVTVKAGLKSAEGQALGKDRTLQAWMPKVMPFLTFDRVGGHLSPQGTMKARVRSSGIREFTLHVYRLHENNLTYYLTRDWDEDVVAQLGAFVAEKTVAVSNPNGPSTTYLDLREFVTTGSAAGVYLLRINASYPSEAPDVGDEEERYQRYSGLHDNTVVVLSNLGVVGKCGDSQSTVWVTALDTAKPVAGAAVQWFSRKNQLLGESVTDALGVAHLENVSADSDRRPFVVVVRSGHDFTYLKLADNQLALPAEKSFARERPFHSRGYEAFATTERGAYRPGEVVHLMGFLRGADYQPPKGAFPIELCVQRADGVMLEPMRVIPSPSGAFESSVSLPRTAPTGLWRAILRLPGQNSKGQALPPPDEEEESNARKVAGELGRVEFFVEEFMPTRLEVKADVPDKRLTTSEALTLRVRANELFGQPAADRPFSVNVLYKPEPFVCPAFAEYSFGDPTCELDRTEETLEGLVLNAQGEADVLLPMRVTRAPAAVRAEIQTVVQDPGGRTVTKREIRMVDPVPFYVGVRLGTSGMAEVNKPLEVRVAAVRPDCSLATDVRELSATISRVVWDSILKRSGGSYSFVTTQRLIPQMSERISLTEGHGQFMWTPPAEGEYVVVVSAVAGGAQTRVPFYATSGVWSTQPWSLEKPEELEIVADKVSYEPGEVARLLVKAPFAGTLLVSLEQDRVTSVSLHQVTANTAELAIPVEAKMAPNVFVTATLVRPVQPADKWLPHRAFGTLSLAVHLPERRLAATLHAPSEIKPDSTLEAEVVLADAKTSAPVEGDVFVWAVDEGVLALTEFATPDPWQFYYGPRRLGVTTADFYADLMPDLVAKAESAPGGGEGAAARRMSPVAAERVRSVVLWGGLMRTDAQGRARVRFHVPAYAGKLRLMAIAAAGARFANGETPVLVRGPVVVREHFPRFLSPMDTAHVPIVVYNNTAATTVAQVAVAAKGPVEIEGGEPWRKDRSEASEATTLTALLEVGPNAQRTAFVTLKAKETIGIARLSVAAVAGDFRHEETLELPVRPAAVPQRSAGQGFVQPGQVAKLDLPREFMPGTTTGILTVGTTRKGELVRALQYNLGYPYGCAEQLISAAFPILAAAEIVQTSGEESFTSEGVAQVVATTCERLSELQTARGGLAMWPGQREPWLWASLYGAHFWLEARRAGYSVGDDQLEALLRYIKSEAFRNESGEALRPAAARERAYAVYVLALAGRPVRDQMELLYDRREELPLGANALLAAAYWKLGMQEAAKQLLAIAPDDAQGAETGRTLASPTREAAVLLATLCEVEPTSARTRALAEKLYAQIKPVGHWGNTQDNAFAIWALARYEKTQKNAPAAKGVVRWRGKDLPFDESKQVVVGLDTLRESAEIVSQGPGAVYYSWFVEGVPLRPNEKAEAQGLTLTRRYLDAKGRDVALDSLKPGQAVFVELSLKADRPMSNVAIVDLLPAAMEIENPNLETAERVGAPANAETLLVDRVEARDDRMIIFTSLGESGKKYVYRYLCRVVGAGNFTVGPAWAECMYVPEWWACVPPVKLAVLGPASR